MYVLAVFCFNHWATGWEDHLPASPNGQGQVLGDIFSFDFKAYVRQDDTWR